MYYQAVFACVLICVTPIAYAHVPYFEHRDYSERRPCIVRKNIEQSKAFYSWLSREDSSSSDIDVYTFSISNRPVRIYVELIVPVIEEYYAEFVPWYALVGPGLEQPSQVLPFDLPVGYGAIVKENVLPGESRDTFYEPFGGKSYYEGPILDVNISQEGDYAVYCWDPYEQGGDYVMVIGKREIFGPLDIIRAFIYTPLIRLDNELHLPPEAFGV